MRKSASGACAIADRRGGGSADSGDRSVLVASVYFREPADVLPELATDGPGFAVGEDAAHLGETLGLPPGLEINRVSVEQALAPLALKGEA
jgi:hypothetical protein